MPDYQETILTDPPQPGQTFSTPDASDTSNADARAPRDTGIEWPGQDYPGQPNPFPSRKPDPYPTYVPIQPRSWSEWGSDSESLKNFRNYPGMPPPSHDIPQPYQANQLYQQIGNFFSQYGSNPTRMFAGNMLAGRGAFMKGVLAGQTAAANAQLKIAELNAVRAAEQVKRESYEYGQIFTLFNDDKDPEKLKQRLWDAANKFQDDWMKQAIKLGDPKKIEALIAYRDTHNDALLKMAEARSKIEAEKAKIEEEKSKAEERKAWTAPPAATPPSPAGGGGPASGATSTSPAAPDAKPPDTTPPDALPGTPTAAPARSYALPPANENVDRAAVDQFMDRKPYVPKEAEGAVTSRRNQYQKALDAIEADPDIKTPDQAVAALRSMMPELAREFQTFLAGKYPISSRSEPKPHTAALLRLGEKVGSDVGPETARVRADTLASFGRGGKMAQNLLMLGTAARHIAGLEKDIGPGGENIPGWSAYLSRYRGVGDVTQFLGLVPKDVRDKAASLKTQGDIAMDELYRSLVGGAGAERGREAKEAMANQAVLMPDVVAQNVKTAHQLMRERIVELRDIFLSGTRGKPSDFEKIFDEALGSDPDAKAAKTYLRELDRGTASAGGPAAPAAPEAGATRNGWRFKGGDPSKRENWERP